ncbi:hypothetical protein BGW36DRAFT_332950 [Talaromyces proteolyticus]|uniref:Uncharacterized protein n=1 Tax=Talaromyces proteolyticus TaxID=1131652 RepID=A0AAD4L6T8_9EURO|nr:uncharacterized protein BGW36DRAFT_332950 [Talaromyces proteolyticus]KAH8705650.1 hypothetical protein BGW36DRAFT_332950 [Talaromyces proteolyticus]
MGGSSSPPFLYDPPSKWSFNDAMSSNFNPKIVTEASRAPRPQRPPQEGPLVNFNRHPDSWMVPRQSKPIIPMSPYTKARVKRTRIFQLLLRLVAILGALAILFCVICINRTDVALGWIIRVAPVVATLHTLYAIYHLGRSAASRPPASSSSYHLFASFIDAGLVPFYTFTSYIAYRETQDNIYGWGTLVDSPVFQSYIVKILFFASAVCGGLHLISFAISLYLAVVFRQITKLPPDMNPLEDNLTARAPKRSRRPKSAISEKHMSTSTLDSAYFSVKSHLEAPIEEAPRTIPFSHTRQQSSNSVVNDQRPTSIHSHRMSRTNLPSQRARLEEQANQSTSSLTRATAQKTRDSPSRPNSIVADAPVLRPTGPNYVPTNFRWSSPAPSEDSGNWEAYPSRTNSPNNDEENAHQIRSMQNRDKALSPVYNDWLGPVPKFGRIELGISQEKARGEYAALEINEGHADYDPLVDKENVEEDITNYLAKPQNPLGMNPPTPQPKEDSEDTTPETRKTSLRRAVLTDIPNLSADNQTSKSSLMPEVKEVKAKKFGSIRIWGRKSSKSAYESVKIKEDEDASADENSDNEDYEPAALTTPKRRTLQKNAPDKKEADRNGRVVSNSGVDLGAGFNLGTGSSSYGEYISGLGVGRRRDVSGKVAEEGRGGVVENEEGTPEKKSNQVRAAGWARFAGL